MGIRRLRGRSFEATDGAGAEPVAIVSESLARQLWPGRDAIGQRVRMAPDPNATLHTPALVGSESPASSLESSWRLVVGVVADVSKTLTEENPPDVYYPLAQAAPAFVEIVVRDRRGRVRLDDVRAAIWRVHADVPLDDIRWLEDDIALATLPSRFLAMLLSGFGAFAVLMASVGVWGVVAYTVSQRRREIAIRMALGATQRAVTATFVRYAAGFTLAGLVSGIAGGLALSRVLRSQLHGVSPGDPVTYGAVALLLAAVAFVATWLPARRAARTEPRSVLQ
jgi:hypothetical protein